MFNDLNDLFKNVRLFEIYWSGVLILCVIFFVSVLSVFNFCFCFKFVFNCVWYFVLFFFIIVLFKNGIKCLNIL